VIIQLAIFALAAMLSCVGPALAADAPLPQDVPRMTKEEAKALLGNKNFVIVDVRLAKDWDQSNSKIKGAVREDPHNVDAWLAKYPKGKTLLFYCS
jgi:rhodanese-related sulfurtransferase